MVDSPHHHAEQRVAGTEQLHFLRDKVLFLGLRLARNGCGNAARRSHLSANQPVIVVRVKILTECPPLEATSSRFSNAAAIHLACPQKKTVPAPFFMRLSHKPERQHNPTSTNTGNETC